MDNVDGAAISQLKIETVSMARNNGHDIMVDSFNHCPLLKLYQTHCRVCGDSIYIDVRWDGSYIAHGYAIARDCRAWAWRVDSKLD